MKRLASAVFGGLLTSRLLAADLAVSLELPRLNVAEYHRPYVAVWLERPDQSFVANLAVWYDLRPKQGEDGTTWLKDLRTWWRKSGRELTFPVDGVSGPTRAPGKHLLVFEGEKAPLAKLPDGDYQLVVEAAREVGGREVVRVPFAWGSKPAAPARASGSAELGEITLEVKSASSRQRPDPGRR